jgi:hypothetical protein
MKDLHKYKPTALLLLFISLHTYSQQIVNDTLYVYGEDIQKVELYQVKNGVKIKVY